MATNSHSGATVKALADVELSERDVRNLAAAFLSLKEPISVGLPLSNVPSITCFLSKPL